MLHMLRSRLVVLVTVAAAVLAGPAAAAQPPSSQAPPVPAAVMQAFRHSYPAATISSAGQTRDGSRTAFLVDSVDSGRRRVVLYEASGRVIEVAEQLAEKDLPAPVAAAMRSHRRAIYVTGTKVTRGGSVTYHLTLRGTRKTAMVAKPDGTVVSFK